MSKEKKLGELIKDVHNIKIGSVNELYKAFIGKTNIEKFKEENFVLSELMRGTSKKEVIKKLKEKHPNGHFYIGDLEKFIERNDQIVGELIKDSRSLALRNFKAREQCLEELASLALFTRKMILELREEKDNTNMNAAIRNLNSLVMNVAELNGFKGPETAIQINTINSDRETKLQELRRRAHRADFRIVNAETSTKESESCTDKNTDL